VRAEPVTIRTVAEQAGVSTTTASDAMRGSGRVSERTRTRVLEVAEALRYVPNGSAQHLRRASTGAIGLHLPAVLTRSNYYMSFVFGVVERAAADSYDVTLLTSGQPESRRTPRVDGLVLGDPLAGDPVVERLMAAGVPTVTCERFPGDARATGVVRSEHAAAVGELLDHLLASGAQRPALIVAGAESDWAGAVHQGFREWCLRHRLAPAVRTVPFDTPVDALHAAANNLLAAEPGIDALVCGPAGAAAALLPVLRDDGRTVGEDLLLASCVDGPSMQAADPPITAIDLRPRDAGAACAALLFDLLTGAAPDGTERMHPTELVVRASTRTLGGRPSS
jgi:DNA-binding LacI/PurR family transcriptional regulator